LHLAFSSWGWLMGILRPIVALVAAMMPLRDAKIARCGVI
jgi:hypothetical protein